MEIFIVLCLILVGLVKVQQWAAKFLNYASSLRSQFVVYTVTVVECFLGVVIKKCQWACDYLHTYKLMVEEHEDDVIVPVLFNWMCNEREEFTAELHYAATAVDECVVEIGLRPRCPTSVECVGRMLRRKLAAIKHSKDDCELESPVLLPSEVVYLSELGTQFYFNPPYHVKAAAGKLSGFQ